MHPLARGARMESPETVDAAPAVALPLPVMQSATMVAAAFHALPGTAL